MLQRKLDELHRFHAPKQPALSSLSRRPTPPPVDRRPEGHGHRQHQPPHHQHPAEASLRVPPAFRLAASLDAEWLGGNMGFGFSRGYVQNWLQRLPRKPQKSDRQA
jgi:hypothetical protein